jgi:hypothetical protein
VNALRPELAYDRGLRAHYERHADLLLPPPQPRATKPFAPAPLPWHLRGQATARLLAVARGGA